MPVNSSKKNELTPKQEKFLLLLLSGESIAASAKGAQCDEKTAHRWLKLETFQQVYQEARQRKFDEDLSGLRVGIDKAIVILKSIAEDTEVPPGARLRAIQIWLEHAVQVGKAQEFEARLADIETAIRERGMESNALRRVG